VKYKRLPMFGVTLICQRIDRGADTTNFVFRQAGSDTRWDIEIRNENPHLEQMARPGACFALVELASVAQVESRSEY